MTGRAGGGANSAGERAESPPALPVNGVNGDDRKEGRDVLLYILRQVLLPLGALDSHLLDHWEKQRNTESSRLMRCAASSLGASCYTEATKQRFVLFLI